jgi:hypothetical protein
MIAVLVATVFTMVVIGKQRNWMPSRQSFQGLFLRALLMVKDRAGNLTGSKA